MKLNHKILLLSTCISLLASSQADAIYVKNVDFTPQTIRTNNGSKKIVATYEIEIRKEEALAKAGSTVKLYDDDGCLTLGLITRYLNQSYSENLKMMAAENLKSQQIPQWEVFSYLLNKSLNILVTGLTPYKNYSSIKPMFPGLEELQKDLKTPGRTGTFEWVQDRLDPWLNRFHSEFSFYDAKNTSESKNKFRDFDLVRDSGQYKTHMTLEFDTLFSAVAKELPLSSLVKLSATGLGQVGNIGEAASVSMLTHQMMMEMIKKNPNENIVMYGESIWKVLRILQELPHKGELEKTLKKLGLTATLDYFKQYNEHVNATGLIGTYDLLLTRQDAEPLPESLQKMNANVLAELGTPGLADKINGIVREKTGGLIDSIVKEENLQQAEFAAFTTAYLKALWETAFEKREEDTFTSADGSRSNITYLVGKNIKGLRYAEDENTLTMALPLKNNKGYFIITQPCQTTSEPRFFEQNSLDSLKSVDSDYREGHKIHYPELDVATTTNLIDTCKLLGLDVSTLDFLEKGRISQFEQKARLKTTKEGVEAAAATMAVISRGIGGPRNFYFNKPHTVSIVSEIPGQGYVPLFEAYIGNLKD